MSDFTQFKEQTLKHFGAMTPATRMMAVALLVVVAVSLFWTLSNYDAQSKSYILGELTPSEIRRIESAFGEASLNEYEVIDGKRIQVPSTQKANYLRAVSDAGAVPSQWGDMHKQSLDSGWFESESARERKFQLARLRELEELLCKRPQIDEAYVALDQTHATGFGDPVRTCCIQVRQAGNVPIQRRILQDIWEMAPSYFAGLSPENVRVNDLSSSLSIRSADDIQEANPLLQAKSQWEDFYAQKLQPILSNYGRVQLMVDVELDPTMQVRKENLRYDPTNVGLTTTTTTSAIETLKPGSLEQMRATASDAAILNQPASITVRTEEKTESSKSLFGQQSTITQTAGLQPTAVKISVGVPKSHYYEVFRNRAPESAPSLGDSEIEKIPTREELSSIEAEVNESVTASIQSLTFTTQDSATEIKVYAYEDIPLPEPVSPHWSVIVLAWMIKEWQTIGLFVIALGCLAFVRKLAASFGPTSRSNENTTDTPSNVVPKQATYSLEMNNDDEGELLDSHGDAQRRVSELVISNPKATQSLLKDWLGDAA